MAPRLTPTKPLKEPTAEVLRAGALAYLERFPASAARVRQILERKILRYCRQTSGADPAHYGRAIEPLIDTLRAAGYIDDAAYARGLAASLSRKGLPVRAAAQKMRLKGLPDDLVDSACGDPDADDFLRALRFARRRKLGPFACGTSPRPPEKTLATLARAGFDYETAARLMRMDPDRAARMLEDDPL